MDFRLGMGMHQEINQKLEQKTKLELGQQLSMRLEFLQNGVLGKSGDELYKEAVERALGHENNEQNRIGLRGILAAPQMVKLIEENISKILQQDPKVLREIAILYLYEVHGGRFEFGEGNDATTLACQKKDMLKAFFNPTSVTKDAEVLQRQA